MRDKFDEIYFAVLLSIDSCLLRYSFLETSDICAFEESYNA